MLHLMQIDMNYDASKTPKYSNAESINKTLRALVMAREGGACRRWIPPKAWRRDAPVLAGGSGIKPLNPR